MILALSPYLFDSPDRCCLTKITNILTDQSSESNILLVHDWVHFRPTDHPSEMASDGCGHLFFIGLIDALSAFHRLSKKSGLSNQKLVVLGLNIRGP